jgi:hypothetical protein
MRSRPPSTHNIYQNIYKLPPIRKSKVQIPRFCLTLISCKLQAPRTKNLYLPSQNVESPPTPLYDPKPSKDSRYIHPNPPTDALPPSKPHIHRVTAPPPCSGATTSGDAHGRIASRIRENNRATVRFQKTRGRQMRDYNAPRERCLQSSRRSPRRTSGHTAGRDFCVVLPSSFPEEGGRDGQLECQLSGTSYG